MLDRNLKCGILHLPLGLLYDPDSRERELTTFCQKLSVQPRPLGIFCVNDNVAYLVIKACQRLGLVVPEDVAVIGVDNERLVCNSITPSISSMEVGTRRLGWEATALLDRALQGEGISDTEILLDPIGLEERESSLGPEVEDEAIARALRLIQANVLDKGLVRSLPGRLGMSRRTFERRFRAALSLSPTQEMIRMRLMRVKRELLSTRQSVKEIALHNGFYGSAHLQKIFQQHVGMSPGAWRQQNQVHAGL